MRSEGRAGLAVLTLAALAISTLAAPSAGRYRLALPGYRYEFPRDHFNHPDFETEWWYYTGNLETADKRRFGFELTFFRQAVSRETTNPSAWAVRDLYLAHLALSDVGGQAFHHEQRLNRAGPGIAGASLEAARIWNGNWIVQWEGRTQQLAAVAERFGLRLTLDTDKPPVIQGENGVSQKAAGEGHASHYISFTRLATRGTIEVDGRRYEVRGTSWMDHEFFTHQLEANQVGWDWLSLQLSDDTELMLYQLRRKDGSKDPFSSGTFVDRAGRPTHLRAGDFTLQPLADTWTSPATGGVYPVRWRLIVASRQLDVEVKTPLEKQEIPGDAKLAPSYWEGAIDVNGTRGGAPVGGVGYLEMTGYAGAVRH